MHDALAWCAFIEKLWPPEAREIEAFTPTANTPHEAIIAHARAIDGLAYLRKLVYPED